MKCLIFLALCCFSFCSLQPGAVGDLAQGLASIPSSKKKQGLLFGLDKIFYNPDKPYDKAYAILYKTDTKNKERRVVIRIAYGELISVGGDVIVDAANNLLAPYATVSAYLYNKTNQATGITKDEWAMVLQQWEKDNNRKFGDGDALFNTHYKAYIPDKKKNKMHLIHAVGPSGVNTEASQELRDTLARAYTESLRIADKNGSKKIVFPAISTGAFGGDPEICGQIEIDAILSYLETTVTQLDEIILLVWSGYDEEGKKKFFNSYDNPLKKYFDIK